MKKRKVRPVKKKPEAPTQNNLVHKHNQFKDKTFEVKTKYKRRRKHKNDERLDE